ncbi:T9SS type A sorting domain-containing protein [candidate division KSB1 bacterium]|nr:T9SS type A sorting domain-containing protein [candidate division KSB1 bacterium]
MKRLLLGLMISMMAAGFVFGQTQVHSQLTLVENIQTGTTDTVIVDVEAICFTGNVTIQEYHNTIGLGLALNAIVDTVLFTDVLFPNSETYAHHLYYPIEIYDSANAMIKFKYMDIFDVPPGSRVSVGTSWKKIARVKILYNSAPAANDSVFWMPDTIPGAFPYKVVQYDDADVTGFRAETRDDMKDLSLPVQMSAFTAAYAPEMGVELNWTTASETNCLGFNILRADRANGEFSKVTTAMIPGQGNSSDYQDYKFVDHSAEWGKSYFYMIHELTLEAGEDSKAYFGPIGVSTDKTPSTFGLSQNYPNPFNPETQIRYYLSEQTAVSLKIYNLLGEEVYTLSDGIQPEGVYTVQWNGQDATGRNLASGIYFYKLIAGDHVQIKKMTKMQ